MYNGHLEDDEVCSVGSIKCTTAARTAYDLGRRLPLDTAIIRIDSLFNETRRPVGDVHAIATRYRGARGIRRLQAALDLVDAGAEPPQETRLRLLLIRAGLPRPVTQIPVRNRWGEVVRRIDMGWRQWNVGVEYDGEQHWTGSAPGKCAISRTGWWTGRATLYSAEGSLVNGSSRRSRTTSELPEPTCIIRRPSIGHRCPPMSDNSHVSGALSLKGGH